MPISSLLKVFTPMLIYKFKVTHLQYLDLLVPRPGFKIFKNFNICVSVTLSFLVCPTACMSIYLSIDMSISLITVQDTLLLCLPASWSVSKTSRLVDYFLDSLYPGVIDFAPAIFRIPHPIFSVVKRVKGEGQVSRIKRNCG